MLETILSLLFVVLAIFYTSWIALFFYPTNKDKNLRDVVFQNISIIIPAHNEERFILNTIKSVLSARYPRGREIIVVNDRSTDRTEEIVREISAKNMRVRIYNTEKHSGKAAAINLGIKKARNDIIISLDADSEVEDEALIKIVKPFSERGAGAVSGIVRAKDGRNPLIWFQDFEYLLSSGWRFIFNKINGTYFFPGFGAFRKTALEEIGGFSKDTLSEDLDIGIRLKKAGYGLVMSDATIYTRVPETPKGLIKQRIRWGIGTIQVMKKHSDVIFNRKYGVVGLYCIPTQIYWYVYGFLYLPIVSYQIFGGYLESFAAHKNYLSLEVAKYFFSWFSVYGMIEYTYKSFIGTYSMDLAFFTLLIMFSLYMLYNILMMLKFSKPKIRFLFVIFFLFPYYLIILCLLVVSCLYNIYNPMNSNRWEKSI
ncbi:MAG: glycosyltransferase family 2 protein [Candidatus Altiarchaeales archaeon]|nr:glycosyltransferase family 2 protein [Candidatus Altiarchaeales archaeon]